MKKIKNLRDLDYQLEIVKIQRGVDLDKLKHSIRKTKSSIFPSILSYAVGTIFKKKR